MVLSKCTDWTFIVDISRVGVKLAQKVFMTLYLYMLDQLKYISYFFVNFIVINILLLLFLFFFFDFQIYGTGQAHLFHPIALRMAKTL